MPRNTTLMTRTISTETQMLDHLARHAPATDELLELADWLAAHSSVSLSAIARLEMAAQLITRRRFLIGAGTLGLGMITGCGPQEEAAKMTTSATRTITDDSGNEVTLDAPPERIVCLTTACIHNLVIFDVLPIAAHIDNINVALDPLVFGPKADTITSLNYSDGWDFEQILALAPDLIVVSSFDEDLSDAIGDSIPIYVTTTNQADYELEDFTSEVERYGKLLGREADAQTFIQRTKDRLAAYDAQTDGSTSMIIMRTSPTGENDFWIPPSCGAALHSLVTCLGEAEEWTRTTTEGLLSLNPDVLVIEDWGEGIDMEAMAQIPLWNELSAVQEGRVHVLSASRTLDYSLLSIANSLDAIMPLAHPETFPDGPLTDEQVQEILAEQ